MQALQYGMAAFLMEAVKGSDGAGERLSSILKDFFNNEDTAAQLATLLKGDTPDTEDLEYLLTKAGYSKEKFPGLHFEKAMDGMKEAYFSKASEVESLREPLKLKKLESQLKELRLQTATLAEIKELLGAISNKEAEDDEEKHSTVKEKHLKKLLKHCRSLPLSVLGGDDKDEEITLDHVYTALDTTTEIEVEEGEKEKGPHRKSLPLAALEAISSNPKVVLQGDPGSGKTTFARMFLAQRIESYQRECQDLPLLIVLRELAPSLQALNLAELSLEKREERLALAVRIFVEEEVETSGIKSFGPLLEEALQGGTAFPFLMVSMKFPSIAGRLCETLLKPFSKPMS